MDKKEGACIILVCVIAATIALNAFGNAGIVQQRNAGKALNNPNLEWARGEAQKQIDSFIAKYKDRYYLKTTDANEFAKHNTIYFTNTTLPISRPLSGVQILEANEAHLVFNEKVLSDLDRANGYAWIAQASYYLSGRSRHYSPSSGWGCWFEGEDIKRFLKTPQILVGHHSALFHFSFTRFQSGKTEALASSEDPVWKVLTKPTDEEIRLIVNEPKRKEGCD